MLPTLPPSGNLPLLVGFFIYLLGIAVSILFVLSTVDRNPLTFTQTRLQRIVKFNLATGLIFSLIYLLFSPSISITLGLFALMAIGNWILASDRTTRVYNVDDEPIVKKYQFFLPRHHHFMNQFMSLAEWLIFQLSPDMYLIEYHYSKKFGDNSRKMVLKIDGDESNLLNCIKESNTLHVCRFCEQNVNEFAEIDIHWNNTKDMGKGELWACTQCYMNLLEDIDDKIPSFEAPVGDLVASRL